ncbi:hypothetical protein MRX96_043714 [Rhipicephalus microplus]
MCLTSVIPALKLRRLRSLILSSHFQCTVAAAKDFIRRAISQAEGLAVFRGDIIDSSVASRRFWTRILHQLRWPATVPMCGGEGVNDVDRGRHYISLREGVCRPRKIPHRRDPQPHPPEARTKRLKEVLDRM